MLFENDAQNRQIPELVVQNYGGRPTSVQPAIAVPSKADAFEKRRKPAPASSYYASPKPSIDLYKP